MLLDEISVDVAAAASFIRAGRHFLVQRRTTFCGKGCSLFLARVWLKAAACHGSPEGGAMRLMFPFPNVFYVLFTRWKHETDLLDLEDIPSGESGQSDLVYTFHRISFVHLLFVTTSYTEGVKLLTWTCHSLNKRQTNGDKPPHRFIPLQTLWSHHSARADQRNFWAVGERWNTFRDAENIQNLQRKNEGMKPRTLLPFLACRLSYQNLPLRHCASLEPFFRRSSSTLVMSAITQENGTFVPLYYSHECCCDAS